MRPHDMPCNDPECPRHGSPKEESKVSDEKTETTEAAPPATTEPTEAQKKERSEINKAANLAAFLQLRIENMIDSAALIAIEPQALISREEFAEIAKAAYDEAKTTTAGRQNYLKRTLTREDVVKIGVWSGN